jgi:hypothetical protein
MISRKCSGSKVKRDTACMRAKYKLSPRKTVSYIRGDSWTGRLPCKKDVHAIFCLFMLHAIWTMHAFKIGITLGVLAMQIARNAD